MSFKCNETLDNSTQCFESHPFPDGLVVWIYNEKLYYDRNIPCVVYLCVLAVLGIFGNSLVIYVYGANFKKRTAHLFILSLSVFDMMCCIPILFEIFDKRFPMYSGNVGILCKLVRIIELFSTVSSTILLLFIALDRYYKVCRPFERKYFSYKKAKKCVIFSMCIGVILCWPIGLVKGPAQINTGVKNVHGYDCADDDMFIGSAIPTVYYSLMGFLNCLTIVILSVLYIQIFRAIKRWKREQIEASNSPSKSSEISSSTKRKRMLSWLNKIKQKPGYSLRESTKQNSESCSPNDNNIPILGEEDNPSNNSEDGFLENDKSLRISQTKQMRPKYRRGRRKNSTLSVTSETSVGTKGGSIRGQKITTNTVLFSVVTIIYIISYLPTICVETLQASGVFKEEELTMVTKRLVVILNATYFINNVANTYVYGAISPLFRKSIKSIFTGSSSV